MSGHHARPRLSAAFIPIQRRPERLVALGFRHWVSGYQSGDVHCWEQAWQIYAEALGPRDARLAVSELSSWVMAVSASARREIGVFPCGRRGFCRDECLAVGMVAACQHDACPALRACAFALIESSLIDEVVHQTESFAAILHSLDQTLSPASMLLSADLAESGSIH